MDFENSKIFQIRLWHVYCIPMACIPKFYSFQYFVDFSTDLDSPVLKFFRTGHRFAHIFE